MTPNLFFDARAAWGLSTNHVNPFGLYADNFSTNRWLAHAKLTGNWRWEEYRLTPSIAPDYIQEHQRDYTDSLGVAIPSQTVSLGRLSFGPEIARRYRRRRQHLRAAGRAHRPWDFVRPEVAAIDGLPVGADAFQLRCKRACWRGGRTACRCASSAPMTASAVQACTPMAGRSGSTCHSIEQPAGRAGRITRPIKSNISSG